LPEEEKLKRADYIIVNDDTHLVIPQVLKLHDRFMELTYDLSWTSLKWRVFRNFKL